MITHSNTEKGVRFLVNKARPDNSLDSILCLLQKKIRILEDNLLKYNILDDPRFKKWQDDKDFTIDLLKTPGICGVYGSGFGDYGKDHVRFTFLPNTKILETIYDLLENFLSKN